MKNRVYRGLLLIVAAIVWLPATAAAKPEIAITIKAEKEVVVTENGKEVKKIVEAGDIFPDEIITYTLSFINSGDETAKGVAVSNRIPPETTYVLGSATEGEMDLSFSIDGGNNFKKPSLLTYELSRPDGTKEKRVATPELYTHIRWVISNLAPSGAGSVNFKVKVK
jgi:uncharacterized repeat protein (TIGR01451 family)